MTNSIDLIYNINITYYCTIYINALLGTYVIVSYFITSHGCHYISHHCAADWDGTAQTKKKCFLLKRYAISKLSLQLQAVASQLWYVQSNLIEALRGFARIWLAYWIWKSWIRENFWKCLKPNQLRWCWYSYIYPQCRQHNDLNLGKFTQKCEREEAQKKEITKIFRHAKRHQPTVRVS